MHENGCDFCRGQKLISKAMKVLEEIPEIGSWYFDDDVTDAYNALDDALSCWEHPHSTRGSAVKKWNTVHNKD